MMTNEGGGAAARLRSNIQSNIAQLRYGLHYDDDYDDNDDDDKDNNGDDYDDFDDIKYLEQHSTTTSSSLL